ncbi:MAG: hypothetical protein WCB67_13040 [Solirubrobacteraceae bacterium]
MRAVRLLVLGLGVVIVAWFVLGARQAREIAQATSIVTQSGPIGPADARRASDLLDAAATLNPDRQVDLLRAALAQAGNRPAQARRILVALTTAEPDNLDAWFLLAQVGGKDTRLIQEAYAHIGALHPPVPDHR